MISQIAVIYENQSCIGSVVDVAGAVQNQHPHAYVWFRTEKELEAEIEDLALTVLRQEEKCINAGPYLVRYRLIEVSTNQ